MNKIILADSQAIFRAGTAKVLAMDEDLRIIAQCTDLDRMHHAITTFPGSIVLFAASLRPDLTQLRILLESTGSRGIVIAENNETAGGYLQLGFRGVVFRRRRARKAASVRKADNGAASQCSHRVVAVRERVRGAEDHPNCPHAARFAGAARGPCCASQVAFPRR